MRPSGVTCVSDQVDPPMLTRPTNVMYFMCWGETEVMWTFHRFAERTSAIFGIRKARSPHLSKWASSDESSPVEDSHADWRAIAEYEKREKIMKWALYFTFP